MFVLFIVGYNNKISRKLKVVRDVVYPEESDLINIESMLSAMVLGCYDFKRDVENAAGEVHSQNYRKNKVDSKLFKIKKSWCIKWAIENRMAPELRDKKKLAHIVKFIFKPSYSRYLNDTDNTDVFINNTQLDNNIRLNMHNSDTTSSNRNSNNENNTQLDNNIRLNMHNSDTTSSNRNSNNENNTNTSTEYSRYSSSSDMPEETSRSNYVEDNEFDGNNDVEYQNENECTSNQSISTINDNNSSYTAQKIYILHKQYKAAPEYSEVKMGGSSQSETLDSLKKRYSTLYGNEPFSPGNIFIFEIEKKKTSSSLRQAHQQAHQYQFCEDCFKSVVS